MPGLLEFARRRLEIPSDALGLGIFRAVFGGLLLVATLRYFVLGWIEPQFLDADFVFSYPGLGFLRTGPAWLTYGRFVAMALAAAALALGCRPRVAAGLFCLLFTWNHLIDRANWLNHYHLISLVTALLAVVPSGRAFSLGRRRSGEVDPLVPAAAYGILRFQFGVVWFFAGVAKLQPEWLVEGQPMGLWLRHRDDLPGLASALELVPALPLLASWAGAAFDLAIPFLLLARGTRRLALVLGAGFHLTTALLFPSIGLFPWIMLAGLLLFVDPDAWRRLAFFGRAFASPSPRSGAAASPARLRRRLPPVLLAALGAWVLVQASLPLRGLIHPGDVLWHERGFRFSWRVMVMEKQGSADFALIDPVTGLRTPVDLDRHLTPIQQRMMATQPDMLLDFREHLRRLHAPAEVEIEAWVTLNGRPPRRLDRETLLPEPLLDSP